MSSSRRETLESLRSDSLDSISEDAVSLGSQPLSPSADEATAGSISGDELSVSDNEGSKIISPSGRKPRYEPNLDNEQQLCLNFAMEHRIFLKAILGLLHERDKQATEIGMNDPNTLKAGSLKKASHIVSGVWRVKFCEVRRGMFSYYEDDQKKQGLLRKNLPLSFDLCSCRAVKMISRQNMVAQGAIFELRVGKSRRLWLAKSRDERQSWIQAINDAMVGGSVTQGSVKENHGKGSHVSSKSPYKSDLKKFLRLKNTLNRAKQKADYLSAIRELLGEKLDVPVQWIKSQVERTTTGPSGAFQEANITSGIEQLWKDLERDRITINGELFEGDGGHSPEKIVAGLARQIIEISHSSTTKSSTRESDAFAYARDVMLSCNRTRSGGDSYFCVDTLCSNPDLIVTIPSSREAEPLSVTVELDETENATTGYGLKSKSGWIRTRTRVQRNWRKRFFVLSEGTLSIYRNASPIPNGLRGQMVIKDATISIDRAKDKSTNFIVSITTKDGLIDRFLYFTSEDKMLTWLYSLELTAVNLSSLRSKKGRSKDAGQASESNAEQSSQDVANNAMKEHVSNLSLVIEDLDERLERLGANKSSAVRVSVEARTEYSICTTDPQGDGEDNWATISSTFLQSFSISAGRILRGEEIVRLHVSECIGGDEEFLPVEGSARRPLALRARAKTEP
jgi:hypothetical protein